MELSRYELAAVKRTAQNVKMLRNKLAKVTEKWEKIDAERKALTEEIENWETPIRRKYGFSSEEILSGEADRVIAEAGQPQTEGAAVEESESYEAPAGSAWDPVPQTAAEETASTEL